MFYRRGQLTLFVILAIVLVAVVIVYLFLESPELLFEDGGEIDFESCLLDATRSAVREISLTGGEADPEFYYMYQDERLPYFCYTSSAYQTCVVQKPMVLSDFESELSDYLLPKVEECYDSSIDSLIAKGYNVTKGEVRLNLSVVPGEVYVDVFVPTTVEGKHFKDFMISMDSQIYGVLMIASSIVQSEATYGDASTSEIMYYYPSFVVDKIKRGDSTTVYIIRDKGSDVSFQFASRSLVWPAGYDVVEENADGGGS